MYIRPLIALIPVVLSACSSQTPAASLTPTADPDAASSAALPAPSPVDDRPLTLWWSAPLPHEEGGQHLGAALAGREVDLGPIDLVPKPAWGSAGILAFLRSTAQAAPRRMPDLVLMPLDALAEARDGGLIQTFEEPALAARAELAFPFARSLARQQESTWAVPFGVDALVSIGREVEAPASFIALRDRGPAPLILPLGGDSPAELAPLMALYASSGGDLRQLAEPDAEALESSLSILSEVLAAELAQTPAPGSSPADTWNAFLLGEQPAALVSGGKVALRIAEFPGIAWRPPPGYASPATGHAWGYALALTASDPSRAARAAALAQTLSDPAYIDIVMEAGLLPASETGWQALDLPQADDYLAFLEAQLEEAEALERSDGLSAWSAAGASLANGEGPEAALAHFPNP